MCAQRRSVAALALLIAAATCNVCSAAGGQRVVRLAGSSRRMLGDVEENVINPGGKVFPTVPPSPYVDRSEYCPSRDGVVVDSRGFPSSPYVMKPFTSAYKVPPELQPVADACNATAGGCMKAYSITVRESTVNYAPSVPGCTGKPARVLAYNGIVPGPTIRVPTGQQTMVRFKSELTPDKTSYGAFEPCDVEPGRQGRPISVHFHGSASLAPYDGWAEDETCGGEVKDYVLPAHRAATLWYHDHALDITAQNAYAGMAGMYIISDNPKDGGSGEPWGLDDMKEYTLALADKVLDRNCQQLNDDTGAHEDNLYGDINTVNGVPWPLLKAQPQWTRFRALNMGVTRPYLLKIVNSKGEDVSKDKCYMVASDGGFRHTPVKFDSDGLFIGIAERYEFVCDLRDYKGQSLYLWNVFNDARMKDVPFFCYSHLVMKIDVSSTCTSDSKYTKSCAATFQQPATAFTPFLDRVLSQQEIADYKKQAEAGRCDRTFVFGRSNGHWVINGEDWFSARVAADTPANAAEIWCLETGGGWFHPVHIHLVDFYVLLRRRAGDYQVFEEFERDTPKDVVQLHPGSQVALLTRWGPHRGEYMFHCHNLRHEDNEMLRSFRLGDEKTRPSVTATAAAPNLGNFVFKGPTGILYDNYHDPRYPDASAVPAAAAPALDANYLQKTLSKELYRVFYPGSQDRTMLCDSKVNPWLVHPC